VHLYIVFVSFPSGGSLRRGKLGRMPIQAIYLIQPSKLQRKVERLKVFFLENNEVAVFLAIFHSKAM